MKKEVMYIEKCLQELDLEDVKIVEQHISTVK